MCIPPFTLSSRRMGRQHQGLTIIDLVQRPCHTTHYCWENGRLHTHNNLSSYLSVLLHAFGRYLFADLSAPRNCHVQSLNSRFTHDLYHDHLAKNCCLLEDQATKVEQVDNHSCRNGLQMMSGTICVQCGAHHKPSTIFQLEKLWSQIVHCSDDTLSRCHSAIQCSWSVVAQMHQSSS